MTLSAGTITIGPESSADPTTGQATETGSGPAWTVYMLLKATVTFVSPASPPAGLTLVEWFPLCVSQNVALQNYIALQAEAVAFGIIPYVDLVTGEGALGSTLMSTTAPLTGGGDLSADRTFGITQATTGTDGYLRALDFAQFDAKMSNPMSALGSLIYGGASGAPTELTIGTTGKFVKSNGTPQWAFVTDADVAFSNITTGNASVSAHGFLQALTGSTSAYLRADGSWATPAAVASGYTTVSLSGDTTKAVAHNFHAYPIVQVLNSSGLVIEPVSITHTSTDSFDLVMSGPTTGTVIASVGSPQGAAYRATSSSGAIAATDNIIETTAAVALTLPDVAAVVGREFTIDNSSSGHTIVSGLGGEGLPSPTIEGQASQSVPPNCAMTVYSNGTVWRIK